MNKILHKLYNLSRKRHEACAQDILQHLIPEVLLCGTM